MKKNGKVFLAFYMIAFALLIILPGAHAQDGLEYVYMLNLQIPLNQSMQIPVWQMPRQGTMDTLTKSLNFVYPYQWQNPFNQGQIPFWPYPWHYFASHAKSKSEPEKPPMKSLRIIEMGPLYAQLFEPYRYLFIADYLGASIMANDVDGHEQECDHIADLMLNVDNFITDPNEIEAYWIARGTDPNLFGDAPDPVISAIFDRDFTVDPTLPIFADEALRIDANGRIGDIAQCVIDQGALGWNATILGYGDNGVQSFLLQTLSIDPYDGMPTYLPAYYAAMDAIATYGKPYFNPTLVFFLESALWNAGVQVWPNIAALDYTPQYFEELVVSIEVSNGVQTDKNTFPITVVTYPVENYAPVFEYADYESTCYVGERFEYVMNCIDPDCFIFSMSLAPATTHTPATAGTFRTDMDGLIWGIRNFYWFGYPPMPWYEQSFSSWYEQPLNPCNGLFSWVFRFEGLFDKEIICSDARGGTTFMTLKIFVMEKEERSNQSPVVISMITQPIMIKAGEEYILHTPNFTVEDPDGDQIYASCNIGEIAREPYNGNFIWKFQTNFSGTYHVELIFYDLRGGSAPMEFLLDVKPWWSY